MITFLPYADFELTARCLDRARLGKQRVEAWQILTVLHNGGRWEHHPAVRMWRGYEDFLKAYGIVICTEWITRGYRDSMLERFTAIAPRAHEPLRPSWFEDAAFHRSHQSNLVRKHPKHYREYFPDTPDNLPYVWPV